MNDATFRDHVRRLKEAVRGQDVVARIGLPGWGSFNSAWIMDFRGKDVILVLDAYEAGWKGARDIAGRFIRVGLPAPRQLILDKGKDLNEFYQISRRGI